MAVAIKITGGEPMYRVIERLFTRTVDARSYLTEMGVKSTKVLEGGNGNRCFKHRGFTFLLSHPLEDILTAEKDLPDTDQVLDLRERNNFLKTTTSTRGSSGDESRKHAGNDASPPPPRSSSKSSSGNTLNLKQLCQELKLDPSKARQKLRKKFGATGARYEWTPDEAVKIREVLTQ